MLPRSLNPTCAACLCLVLVGCGSKHGTVSVDGLLTLDGKPFPNATLMFTPVDGKGRNATGQSDAQGAFKLSSYGNDDGGIPGDYRVVVFTAAADSGSDPMKMSGAKRIQELKQNVLHPNFSNPNKTPIVVAIPAKGGKVEINLKADGTS